MSKKDAKDLLQRYHTGKVTKAEKALVESWYHNFMKDSATGEVKEVDLLEDYANGLNKALKHIHSPVKFKVWPYAAIAATVLLLVMVRIFIFNHYIQIPRQNSVAVKALPNDFMPGSHKAVLTLSNGETISLTGTKSAVLAVQGASLVKMGTNGQISYNKHGNQTNKKVLFNTLTIPKGGHYAVVLSDGTRVQLNAASSLTYPAAFSGNERKVALKGEAFFEVAHNRQKPFRVVSEGQIVEVLGTRFNINAYDNEKEVKTTLLKGSVKVSANGNSRLIKPGEQLRLSNKHMRVQPADLEEVMAWTNGLFYFKDADFETVMRQLARWYNFDVSYAGEIPKREFSGAFSKDINASQLLKILTFKKINYRINGRTLIIESGTN